MELYTVTKEIEFAAAHRLPGHPGKCKSLHGHTFVARVHIQGKVDRATGMVMDFDEFKKIKEWIDTNWDHNTILAADDPLVDYLMLYRKENGKAPYLMPQGLRPTSECLSIVLLEVCRVLYGKLADGLKVKMVQVFESPRSAATILCS